MFSAERWWIGGMLRLTSKMKIKLLFLFCLFLLQLHASTTVHRASALIVTFITVERTAG